MATKLNKIEPRQCSVSLKNVCKAEKNVNTNNNNTRRNDQKYAE